MRNTLTDLGGPGLLTEVSLSSGSNRRLARTVTKLPRVEECPTKGAPVRWLRRLLPYLPKEVTAAAERLRSDPFPPAVLVIHNLPVGSALEGLTHAEEVLLLGLASLFGDVYGYRSEGGLIRRVGKETGKRSPVGLEADNGFRVEHAYFEARPRFLAALCLQSGGNWLSPMRVADVRDVLPLLSKREESELRRRQYHTRCPLPFDLLLDPHERRAGPHPIIGGADNCPEVRVAAAEEATLASTPEGLFALTRFQELADEVSCSVPLSAGDLLVLNNRLALHTCQ